MDSGPAIPDGIMISDLDPEVRSHLRGLTKENAEFVGRHLVASARTLDSDVEASYAHALAAVRRGGRIDVVREAAGIAAYYSGRYAEALRELRTVRRLNGSQEYLPMMADCERGLGRPERALDIAASDEARELNVSGRVEMAIVASGARLDLEQPDAALAALRDVPALDPRQDRALVARLTVARATALEVMGRDEEASAALATARSLDPTLITDEEADDEFTVFDLDEDETDVVEGDPNADEYEDDFVELAELTEAEEASATTEEV